METATEKLLGDYKLLKYLGRGGFGSVYLAEQRFLKKQCVIKILNPTLSADKDFIERFEKDVATLASLNHSAILKVHAISYAEGRYFLALDAVIDDDGNPCNLWNYLNAKKKIGETEILAILRQVASALDYAHQFSPSGITHRGLKPTNIFIKEEKEGIRVFLSDFELSKIIGEGRILLKVYEDLLKELSTNDLTTSFLQHYHFLSPEQKAGKKGEVDGQSDVYAFGILTYFLLTGTFPEGYFELPSKICQSNQFNWDFLISKCLQKDKSKRPTILCKAINELVIEAKKSEALSWDEISKRVENSMELSFDFLSDVKDPSEENHSLHPIPHINPSELAKPIYDPDPGAIFHKEANVSLYHPQKTESKEIAPILTEMVIIPGGLYLRGNNEGARDETPRHNVSIFDFALDIHPVTNEQFVRFLDAMGGEKDVNNNDLIRLRDSRIKRSAGKLSIEAGYGKHPVVGVTWYGAYAYAKWVGKRLPTEAEWEIAASGGLEKALYPTGNNIDHTQANFFSSDTTAVMSYPPNGCKLYDMVGNVYEWCADWYAYNYYETSVQEPENPKGPPQGVYRVLRGGCWKSLKEDLRCSHRHRNNPGTVNGTYGFRCAADVS